MDTNPVLKPKLATPALIMSSAAVSFCLIYLVGTVAANGQTPLILTLAAAVSFLLTATVCAVWFARARRQRAWKASANEKWTDFDDAKVAHRTTAEISVLSVDGLEPTGSWITIRWNRFDHVQRAWIEALPEPIWPGSVLLISPDAEQVMPGMPWPPVYLIRASSCLAWAPGAVDSSMPRPQG